MQDSEGKGKKVGKKILIILAIIVATLLALYALLFSYTNRILALFIVSLGVLTVAVGYLFVKKYIKIYNNYKTKTLNATNNAQKKWYKNTTIVRFVILSLVAVGALLIFSGIIVEYCTKDATAIGVNLALGGLMLVLICAVSSIFILVEGREEPDFTDEDDETHKDSISEYAEKHSCPQDTYQDSRVTYKSKIQPTRKEKILHLVLITLALVSYLTLAVLAVIFEHKEDTNALYILAICMSVLYLAMWVYQFVDMIYTHRKKCKLDADYAKSRINKAIFVIDIILWFLVLALMTLLIISAIVIEKFGIDSMLFWVSAILPLIIIILVLYAINTVLKAKDDPDDLFPTHNTNDSDNLTTTAQLDITDNNSTVTDKDSTATNSEQTPNSHNNQ